MKQDSDNIFAISTYQQLANKTGAEIFVPGYSLQGRPILALKKGSGNLKLLLIARLHGNEPAPTQAMLEFFLRYDGSQVEVYGICLANPDGASLFDELWRKNKQAHWKNNFEKARLNSAEVDLNRDWLNLTQKETRVLRQFIFALKPDFVVDHHEFYWAEGFPPKYPTEEKGGFMATMTDAPFYRVHDGIKIVSETAMNYLIAHLRNEFQWEIKPRHFVGDSKHSYVKPDYLGIYLALRGIPKLLVETWGVACSLLLWEQRVAFHRHAMQHVVDWMVAQRSYFENKILTYRQIEFNIDECNSDEVDLFCGILKQHEIGFDITDHSLRTTVPVQESGFVETVHHFIFQKENCEP